jgi:hypothetical protein
MGLSLPDFVAKWSASGAAERANKDAFLIELCDVLDVPRPAPTTGDPARDTYVFEKDAILPHEGGTTTIGKIDLYKEGAFILEAKQGSDATSKKLGTAKRGTPAWAIAMNGAYGQALHYSRTFDRPVPFLVGCDIGHCFDLYAAFDGSWNYRPFPDATRSRLYLRDLEGHRETLRRVFTDPFGLDPSRVSAKVTREVATHLAELAKQLEHAGHKADEIATFLMRCLFTMFAEDVGLLPERIFTDAIEKLWLASPRSFPGGIESLWKAMNEGSAFGFVGKLLRFNGGLFASPTALPLTKPHLELLLEAAKCNWADVEPAIFGTLLERALDPKERHALGAHYTPRAYVERLVRPTIEEPLRADWDLVKAEVHQLVAADKLAAAKKAVQAFHQKLCATRVLDPACGSGNFLYVTLDLFKRLEGEVLALLEALGETQTLLHADTIRVTPAQFLGIEVKRWAKEIAELVLWIGYLQHHFRGHGNVGPPPEPVLQDYKNIECRDAVLAWDAIELVRDENGKPVTRWDGETYKKSPVTGEDVPDETARVAVEKYVNPRKAEWPKAEFIVGNPPFMGNKRMRAALGDGWASGLRAAYAETPESVDLVMYWWWKAARIAEQAGVTRFGFITTNSITQGFNKRVVEQALGGGKLSIVFAIPDHPWVDERSGADVRVALSVMQRGNGTAGKTLEVVGDERVNADGTRALHYLGREGVIRADLKTGANVTGTSALAANQGLVFQGVVLVGEGFRLSRGQLGELRIDPERPPRVVRRYFIGRDISQVPEERWVIDFFGLTEAESAAAYPDLFQHLITHVRPFRAQNRRDSIRNIWWRFAWDRPLMREALSGLPRYIVTCRTAKHRVFQLFDSTFLPDAKLVVVCLADAHALGVLSSRAHVAWAFRAGGFLGVGNDPDYVQQSCFGRFPFPAPSDAQSARIRDLGESLDAHRKRQQALHPDLTITGMYNVLEKLRSGEVLTAKEKVIHEHGLVSVLRQIHDDLDAAVFDAYGWPHDLTDEQILERLVALNAERAEEERNGLVRWLRPEFQNPAGTKAATQTAMAGVEEEAVEEGEAVAAATPWPKKMAEQAAVLRDLVAKSAGEWTAVQAANTFKGAKAKDVEDVMDALAAVGVLAGYGDGRGRRWRSVA